jgi:cytochrome c-type biogenesis protein CcmE
MNRRLLKFLLLGGGVVGSMLFLLAVGISRPGGMVYYQTVTEFLEDPAQRDGTRRINGKVVPGSIERLPTGQDVRFEMSDGARSLRVAYRGIVPDTFVDEADVVVEGVLGPDGTFQASTLLAKCPSKYEAAADRRSGS